MILKRTPAVALTASLTDRPIYTVGVELGDHPRTDRRTERQTVENLLVKRTDGRTDREVYGRKGLPTCWETKPKKLPVIRTDRMTDKRTDGGRY